MKTKNGIAVSPGVAIAPAVIVDTEEFDVPERRVDDARAELDRLKKAIKESRNELLVLQKHTVDRIGKETASIFNFHLGLLADKVLIQKITDTITNEHVTAEYAVASILRGYAKEFLDMPQYLAERVRDVYDIEKRLLRNLTGQKKQSLGHLKRNVVVLAHDMTPSQTVGMDRKHILALAMDAGGPTSHTAIVARALGIPAVVGLNDVTADANAGNTVIIDGNRGLVIIEPDAPTLDYYRKFEKEQVEFVHSLDALRDLPAITKDGHEIELLGNIEFPEEASFVLEKGGHGIGLYRTEFLYLDSDDEPTEKIQFKAYRKVQSKCGDYPVVIRTLDLGADKFTQSRARSPERNPMLGCRSIRLSLADLPTFRKQIRAVLRAGTKGNIRMMFPLITTLTELRTARSVVMDVIDDLEEEGIAHNRNVPIGMMVETPAAALMCEIFAPEVDFFSIGTNDLVQFTLAVDRGNEKVAPMFSSTNPAVLRLIQGVVQTAQKHNIDVSICGEIAGDPRYTILLLGLGLEKLSCSAPSIPEVKKTIRSVSLKDAKRVAQKALELETQEEIDRYLMSETKKVIPEAYPED